MSIEVGDRVKVMVDEQPWLGTVITYTDDDPPVYKVNVFGIGSTIDADESDLTVISSGGSGGGGNSGEIFYVTYTWDDGGTNLLCDQTCADIVSAHEAGKLLVAVLQNMVTANTIINPGEAVIVSFVTVYETGIEGAVVTHRADEMIEFAEYEP